MHGTESISRNVPHATESITTESMGELNWAWVASQILVITSGAGSCGGITPMRHRPQRRTYTTTHTTSAGRRKSEWASPMHVRALASSLKHPLPDHQTYTLTPIGNSKTIAAFNLTHIWHYMHGPESNSANVSQIPAIVNGPNARRGSTRRTTSSNIIPIRKLTLQVLGPTSVNGPHQGM